MIAHGRKQISEMVYARLASEGGGAVRLTNMIRGGSVVFGWLAPSFKWLTSATRQAILAAFGQTDGTAVIKATNRYLNVLAASDRDKAQALAGFINEDPMMVCSLGLSVEGVTMPIRYSIGKAQFSRQNDMVNTFQMGVFKMEADFKLNNRGQTWNTVLMVDGSDGTNVVSPYWQIQFVDRFLLADDAISITIPTGSRLKYGFEMASNGTRTAYAGNVVATRRGSKSGNYLVRITNATTETEIYSLTFVAPDLNLDGLFLPTLNAQGKVVLVDVYGSGIVFEQTTITTEHQIAYTLPDGTPWTPLNQQ